MIISIATAANNTTGVNPNNANASLKSTAGDDTINIGTVGGATLINNTTNIDASAGNDILNIRGTGATGAALANNANATPAAATDGGKPTLTSVEKIVVTYVGGNGGDAGGTNNAVAGIKGNDFLLDLSGSTGVKEVWNDTSLVGVKAGADTVNNGVTTKGGAVGDTVTFSNIALGTVVGVKGDTTAKTVFNFTGANGSNDSATLNLQGATGAAAKDITINSIENLTLAVNGASKVSITDNTLDKVIVTGTGNLEFASSATSTKSFDASALNGSATIDVSSAVNGVTVTGTKFADSITLNNANPAITTDKDVIVYNSGNISTASVKDTITNFTTGEDKIDVKAFTLTAPNAVTNLTAAPGANAAATTAIAKFVYTENNATFTDVYVDTNKSGTFDVNDLVIKLAGNVDVKVTDFTFA